MWIRLLHYAGVTAPSWPRALLACGVLVFAAALLLLVDAAQAHRGYYFECPELHSGETLTLEELAEELPLIVHVWGPDCPHCRVHMPYLAALYGKLDLELVSFVALSITGDEDEIMEYVEERELSFPVLCGTDGDFSELFEEEGWPTTFVFAPGGEYVGWCDIQGPAYITEMLALVEEAGYRSVSTDSAGDSDDDDSDDDPGIIKRNPRGRSGEG